MAQTILYIIIAFIVAGYIFNLVLEILNMRNQSDELPERLSDFYDEEKYRKSQQYDKAKTRMSLISSTISTIAIVVILMIGGFAWLDEWVRSVTEHPVLMTLLFFGVLYLISDILSLPFSIYNTFVIEEKFGFNRTTPKLFIIDKIKGLLLTVVLGGGILALLVTFYLWAEEWFWLYAWIAVSAISLFFAMFYTSVLVPIFNKLTPLPEGELRTAIERYSEKVDFPLKNIFVMDGSKRSTKANAFFSGLGNRRSIVLFDTLIEKHTNEELVAVLAHEVGHYKKKHILQSIILSIFQTGVLFFLLGLFIKEPVLSAALGADEHSFHLGLLTFTLLYSPVSMIIGILMSIFSRKNEYEADAFAAKTYNPLALQEALKKLSVENLSNLEPHPAYVFVHYSHPPVLKRLRALDRVADAV